MRIDRPTTRYAKSGDLSIAYQVFGDGPHDLVLIPAFVSHLELAWEMPHIASFLERLASFCRVILFDKRGTGVSDPVEHAATLEDRMDDVRAVLDAVGSERVSLLGLSEGAPMAILFAATYPERVHSLMLFGGMARSTEDVDYPWASPRDALIESALMLLSTPREDGPFLEIFSPSIADDPAERERDARFGRMSVSPKMLQQLFLMFLDIDVREVLPTIQVPTLVLHRYGDRVVNVRNGRYLAEHIPGARYVELQGTDHSAFTGDAASVLDEIEEFLTGTRSVAVPERVLATVMFTDLVDSTARASALGDAAWRAVRGRHDAVVRHELERFRGVEVKTLGDGFLATFDGPARAIRCASEIARAVSALGLGIRIGLHTGECEVSGNDVSGIAVHVAARIAAHADAGEVLASSTVRDLVAGSGIGFAPRGEQQLKGLDEPWRLFAVQP